MEVSAFFFSCRSGVEVRADWIWCKLGTAKDVDGDEDDGIDETICPLDFQSAGEITDDVMHEIMVRSVLLFFVPEWELMTPLLFALGETSSSGLPLDRNLRFRNSLFLPSLFSPSAGRTKI